MCGKALQTLPKDKKLIAKNGIMCEECTADANCESPAETFFDVEESDHEDSEDELRCEICSHVCADRPSLAEHRVATIY